ncbi:type I secretion system permease/ATPase [Stutzerimonas kirkiae]|uniref:Type I secretion system permease/ATPase n=1 Tax=Stutzerimonas kirkiae TaxID=2211392 RepID=A0A4Q9RB79_9GAMM|nr:type I secretion system permease/ATPase [Stutzerimonas kirkiae]TBU98086.1 type I secretion system permease/ATPase [Stutzerimonas kirkiae]TBV02893.1 type I secretion system permease/ATPase [Stutzerimonas kirkiae]TBV09156.1 type I secretion system permease/ATPase [Stutzerimonas kirkiae]TBV11137.1 type I secretion system permease/ATPase [Stutzerimonas kirkiae]
MEVLVDDPLSTCLLWIAQSNGVATSRDAIVDGLPLLDGRLAPSVFPRAAERAGFTARLARQDLLRLNELLLPCIALQRGNKACLLERVDAPSKKAWVRFPELDMQLQEVELDAFQANYSGVVMYCRADFRLLEKHDTGAKRTLASRGHWFWSVIRENRVLYRDVLVAAFFINLFALAMPLFVMNVYDRVVPNHATDTLWVLSFGAVILICGDLLLRMLRGWFVELAASRADTRLSALIMERVLGMRLEHSPASIGSFASSVNGFEAVRSFIGSMTVTALLDLPFFLLFVVIIMVISWVMAIPVLVGAALIILYALSVQARMRQLSEVMSKASAQRSSGLIESLSGIETLKSFNATSRMQSNWEQSTRFLCACSGKLRMLGNSVGSGASWVQQMVAVCMIIVGVYLVIDGQMTQGALIAAYMLSSRAMAPVSQTASLLTQYYQAATALASLEQLMANGQERSADKPLVSRPKLRGEIELRNVSFKYPGDEREVLRDVSLHIRAGERVAILGRVGSGKSTLEKLILGLYQPTAGTILVDGVHLAQFDPAELRRNIGYIPQETRLISGTVYENVTLGVDNPERQRLHEAIEISGLKGLVGAHADGLGMQVGEGGSRVSGGQRQTIAVARAVMPDSSILLFDEPTSAMDSTLENHVTRALGQFSQGKTLLLVTHRTSLLALVDRLIVMDGGRVLADGPKQSVLQALEAGTLQKVAP